jgi:hypothetical protein
MALFGLAGIEFIKKPPTEQHDDDDDDDEAAPERKGFKLPELLLTARWAGLLDGLVLGKHDVGADDDLGQPKATTPMTATERRKRHVSPSPELPLLALGRSQRSVEQPCDNPHPRNFGIERWQH